MGLILPTYLSYFVENHPFRFKGSASRNIILLRIRPLMVLSYGRWRNLMCHIYKIFVVWRQRENLLTIWWNYSVDRRPKCYCLVLVYMKAYLVVREIQANVKCHGFYCSYRQILNSHFTPGSPICEKKQKKAATYSSAMTHFRLSRVNGLIWGRAPLRIKNTKNLQSSLDNRWFGNDNECSHYFGRCLCLF